MNFEFLNTEEYAFLKQPEFQKYLMLLTIGGSHAYGMNVDTPEHTSDIDLRGILFHSKEEILRMEPCMMYTDDHTDTTLYGFHKIVHLFQECNPNTLELLGCRKEDYAYIHPMGELLLQNKDAFLSKRAIFSFGNYAEAQLHRLRNALARDSESQRMKEEGILKSVNSAIRNLNNRYRGIDGTNLHVYIDTSEKEDRDTEVFIDINLQHCPLRSLNSLQNELVSIPRSYDKVNHRNRKKDATHLNKHAAHLVRLILMLHDLLRTGEIITYREKDRELLLDIRNGRFMLEDGTYDPEFFKMVDDLTKTSEELAKTTKLPDQPDHKRILDLILTINAYALEIDN